MGKDEHNTGLTGGGGRACVRATANQRRAPCEGLQAAPARQPGRRLPRGRSGPRGAAVRPHQWPPWRPTRWTGTACELPSAPRDPDTHTQVTAKSVDPHTHTFGSHKLGAARAQHMLGAARVNAQHIFDVSSESGEGWEGGGGWGTLGKRVIEGGGGGGVRGVSQAGSAAARMRCLQPRHPAFIPEQ